MLVVEGINTYYDTGHILQGVSLTVPAGRTVTVLGRNGVGKTTLIRSIMGTTPPRSGTIRFMDQVITGLAPHAIANKGIALVPQGRRIFASLTVRENLELGIKPAAPDAPTVWTMDRIHQLFPILKERANQFGTSLSGGEQQMLAVARALLSNPKLLLMDEPSEGLAPQKVAELGGVINAIKQSGLSVLLVEQKITFALRFADEVHVLTKGTIGFSGTPAELSGDRALLERLLGVAPS
jgi:branched-chain amino acid transport system ATP-binding protein